MHDAPTTRPSLLLRLRDRRDQQAWREFAEIYEPLVYRLGRSKGLQHADALDLTQDVFTAVGGAIERFDPDPAKGSFRKWLHRIARNLMINLWTREKGPRGTGETAVHRLLEEQPDESAEAVSWFELEYRREVFRCAAERVKDAFSAETWRAFWLTTVDGESTEDVAALLGKTCGAVRIARCRVLARMKQEVGKIEEG